MPTRSDHVEAVRSFNRFYTQEIGALGDRHLASSYSLTEVRVLFELFRGAVARGVVGVGADHGWCEVAVLRDALELDASYLSRILRRFERAELIERERHADDARRQLVWLTPAGRTVADELDRAATEHIGDTLGVLNEGEQQRLVGAMRTISTVWPGAAADQLGGSSNHASSSGASTDQSDTARDASAAAVSGSPLGRPAEATLASETNATTADTTTPQNARECMLRAPGPGDFGWVVYRHGVVYHEGYGWDERFEALVAQVVADYVADHDPEGEAGWIAELDGTPVGCVFCMRDHHDATGRTAKLRLLVVEPSARGTGVGSRLVGECVRFARAAGYERMDLWTVDVLAEARSIYQREGFVLVSEDPTDEFGPALTGQTWRLEL